MHTLLHCTSIFLQYLRPFQTRCKTRGEKWLINVVHKFTSWSSSQLTQVLWEVSTVKKKTITKLSWAQFTPKLFDRLQNEEICWKISSFFCECPNWAKNHDFSLYLLFATTSISKISIDIVAPALQEGVSRSWQTVSKFSCSYVFYSPRNWKFM